MAKYILKRFIQSILVILLVVCVVFFLLRLMPSDYFFTEDELIINMKSRKVSSIYKLSDIKSAAIAWDPSARTWNLIVRGDNDKLLKGESSDGKNRKAKRLGEQHTIEKQSKDALWDLLMKHAPHVTKADI